MNPRGASAMMPGVTNGDNAADRAETSVRQFIEQMAAQGNPGSGRHEIGMHHVVGWILEYDPSLGGFEIQAVLGLDGMIHARREPRSVRTHSFSASEWVARAGPDDDPTTAVAVFDERLAHLLAFETRDTDEPWTQLT